jgi:prepilin-type N-terminal cleavage/methylation domain-containing protein
MSARRHNQRGFNLVEISIVLGVAAVILSAIWAAGSAASENARRGQFTEQLTAIVTNIRANYSGQAGIFGDLSSKKFTNPAGGMATLTGFLAIQGTIPGDMVRNPSTFTSGGNPVVDDAWGSTGGTANGALAAGSLGICAWSYAVPTNQDGISCGNVASIGVYQYFSIELTGLRTDSCIAVVTANSTANGPSGLQDVVINGRSVVFEAGVLPVSVSEAATLCPPPPPSLITVDFVYALHPPTM